MIRENSDSKDIDAEVGGLQLDLLFQPDFSMVEILAAQRIIAHQEAPPHGPIHDVHTSDFIR